MAYLLIALVALGAVLGYSSIEGASVERAQYTAQLAPGALDGTQFAIFSYAMEQYVDGNPAVSGTIPSNAISGNFTPAFLNNVTTWVSAPAASPRALVVSAKLGSGALQSALAYSHNDASFGTPLTNDTQWTSAAGLSGSTPEPLPNAVPNGSSVVFVVNFN